MTKRLPVAIPYMNWRDGQQVDQADLQFEQSHNLQSSSAIVNNFFGSGLIPYSPVLKTLFDSDELSTLQSSYVGSNDFDGRGILPTLQPTDTLLGAQIKFTLSDSEVTTRKSVKVCLIGLNFENTVQYEFFYFFKNETQISKKHYKNIITLLFNDFKGNSNCSLNLGGRMLVQEALPMELSRDSLMAVQNLEPNLFFRDFKVVDQTVGPNVSMVLYDTLQDALNEGGPTYSVDSLDINIGYLNLLLFEEDDITIRYGQKFKATCNNIQKIRLLLGIQNNNAPANTLTEDSFDWTGDLILSVHALQVSVACPTDSIPDNAIDYSPNPAPIAQIVITQATLASQGIILTDIAQPIDFIFSSTRLGAYINTGITAGNYYIVTIQRAGDASSGILFTESGNNISSDSIFSTFNGVTWTDDATQSLWFEVYADAIKVADGIGYDEGNSVSIPKTSTDATTGATIDYSKDAIPFANNGQDVLNYVVVQSVNDLITEVQDDRTGSPVYSQQTTVAEISTLTKTGLASLMSSEEPIILGYTYDINNRSSYTINGTQNYIGLVDNYTYHIVNAPPEIKLHNLIGAKFTPNTANPVDNDYIIYKVLLCTDGFGDLNNDGYVGANDVLRAYELLNEDITTESTQNKIIDGTINILEFLRADIDGDGFIAGNDVVNIEKIYNKDLSVVLPFGATFERITLYLENFIGRTDYYHQCTSGYARIYYALPTAVSYTTLDANELLFYGYPVPVEIISSDSAFETVPFVATNYRITITPKWMEQLVKCTYTGRLLPCSFTDMDGPVSNDCSDPVSFSCSALEKNYNDVGGQNNYFVPGNLIIGDGSILGPDGNNYPIDFESNTINLILPNYFIDNQSIDLFNSFVAAENSSSKFTSKAFPAMKFADCSYVQKDALVKNQVRFSVGLSSLSQIIDGVSYYSDSEGQGIISDPLCGTYLDQESGILTITSSNVNASLINPTENCKISIQILLKKAGWKNKTLNVFPSQLLGLLGINSN